MPPSTSRQPKEILLRPQLQNQNMNYYLTSLPEISLDKSEEMIEKKYRDLLIEFFHSHQPRFIFEPVRKEYYWTNDSFDDEKISRLEKLLQNTSYLIQNLFWYLRIFLAIFITIPIEIFHTILAGLIKPICTRLPMILSDTFIKPFYAGLFNALILPMGILLWNTSELLAKIIEPLLRLFLLLFEPCFQWKSSKPLDSREAADGRKKSIVYV